MNKSNLGHIQINVRPENFAFYKDLLTFLGWSVIYEDATVVGLGDGSGASLWFASQTKEVNNDYDGTGMNHIGFNAQTQADVDEVVAYIHKNEIQPLFDTPRHRPEFCSCPENDYYQVMFESPDQILLEVNYTGPISK
jgi:hypothetical protein